MSDPVRRARAQFSTIQITMVSIVVALALQELLERLPTIDALWTFSWVGVRLWCQALVAFAIIVKMWTGFVLSASIGERIPRPIDLLGPMGILVFVDAQIASIGTDQFLRWACVLGIGSLIAGAFIAAQRRDFVPRPAAGIHGTRRFTPLTDPVVVETTIGALALALALFHLLAPFGESGVFIACVVLLLAEIGSSFGPFLGWRILRRIEDRPPRSQEDVQPS